MYRRTRLVAAAAVVVLAASACRAQMRTWTDNTGKYTVQAELVKLQGTSVVLKRSDGAVITVPVARLSQADQALVKRAAASAHEQGPAGAQPGRGPLWTMDLAKMKIPDKPASGLIHGRAFHPDRTEWELGGNLVFRQGKDFFPDLSLELVLFLKEGEKLAGRTFRVSPKSEFGNAPHVRLSWRDQGNNVPESKTFMGMMDEQYAMILEFGQASGGKLAGRIYVCLPDKAHSVVAGTFTVPEPAEAYAAEEKRMREEIKDPVTIEVSGVENEADSERVSDLMMQVFASSGLTVFISGEAPVVTATVGPVKDVQAFARKIRFGKVTSIKGRTIKVQYGK